MNLYNDINCFVDMFGGFKDRVEITLDKNLDLTTYRVTAGLVFKLTDLKKIIKIVLNIRDSIGVVSINIFNNDAHFMDQMEILISFNSTQLKKINPTAENIEMDFNDDDLF